MQDPYQQQNESRKAISILLRKLSSADASSAWAGFLDMYAPLLMHTASQFVYDQERINDCFLYVCEQLSDQGFRRLLKYNTEGRARFRTWLGTVVFNLCVDWHRREFGRATLSPAISALPAFDQAVYRLVVEQGLDKESAFQTLLADFPDLTRDLVAKAAGRGFALLTSRQRWQVGIRQRGRKPAWNDPPGTQPEDLPDPQPGPDKQAQASQDLESLQRALGLLPAGQRLLLRLRFEQGLSLAKIAQLQNLGDTNRTWRHLQDAIKALSLHLQKSNPVGKQKN